jgi:hypothetical protein
MSVPIGVGFVVNQRMFFLFVREENGQEITMVFDCRNAGLKNLDMELVQFIIGRNAFFTETYILYIILRIFRGSAFSDSLSLLDPDLCLERRSGSRY